MARVRGDWRDAF